MCDEQYDIKNNVPMYLSFIFKFNHLGNNTHLLGASVDGDSVFHSLKLRGAHLRWWQRVNFGFSCCDNGPGSCISIFRSIWQRR